ncbi:hypothetical protein O181_088625 [Austropuccinia psidii MF-1]|uniref:Uncharacterized protein n=1 Tax=Austropuccinia psidii MF-1 TaxID=1389203 RepID=A0A9Q3IRU1_9BASI|nr:hypothetical protein [Austropuccinia psidii MF-1]
MLTSLLDRSKVIIQPMKDVDGKRTLKLGLIVPMGFKFQTKPSKSPAIRDSCSLYALQANSATPDKPSQPNEPPIPGPSQPSEPREDTLTCEPEPEVAPTQSMEEPVAHPATPTSVIIIDDAPVGSLPPLLPRRSQKSPPPWRQATLIPTMRLARNLGSCNQTS